MEPNQMLDIKPANTNETAVSLLAQEIARELAPLLQRNADESGPDPKGLRGVQAMLLRNRC